MTITVYPKWPKEQHARWIKFGHTFGRHLMESARDYAFQRIDPSASAKSRALAEKAALDAIYGVLMLFDGIPLNKIGPSHAIDYALLARVREHPDGDNPVEVVELAPRGDGLCVGYHMWVDGEYE
jgi:hypothetical protein